MSERSSRMNESTKQTHECNQPTNERTNDERKNLNEGMKRRKISNFFLPENRQRLDTLQVSTDQLLQGEVFALVLPKYTPSYKSKGVINS